MSTNPEYSSLLCREVYADSCFRLNPGSEPLMSEKLPYNFYLIAGSNYSDPAARAAPIKCSYEAQIFTPDKITNK
jgi:hypothetical protein